MRTAGGGSCASSTSSASPTTGWSSPVRGTTTWRPERPGARGRTARTGGPGPRGPSVPAAGTARGGRWPRRPNATRDGPGDTGGSGEVHGSVDTRRPGPAETAGAAGAAGTAGTAGTVGTVGTAGTAGTAGTVGPTGTAGAAGTAGTASASRPAHRGPRRRAEFRYLLGRALPFLVLAAAPLADVLTAPEERFDRFLIAAPALAAVTWGARGTLAVGALAMGTTTL
ncbi:hypothetical protein GT043_07330, partial [Streptomyces sp. SID2131]|nr:hypothetical protein [Streptomyces sp. SID2131]